MSFDKLAAQTNAVRENADIPKVSVKAPANVVKELGEKEYVELGEKIIAEYIPNIPETDREKFIATARIVIVDAKEEKVISVEDRATKGGVQQYRKMLDDLGYERYESATEIQNRAIKELTNVK